VDDRGHTSVGEAHHDRRRREAFVEIALDEPRQLRVGEELRCLRPAPWRWPAQAPPRSRPHRGWAVAAVAGASGYVAASWLYDNREPIGDAVGEVEEVIEDVVDGARDGVCRTIPTMLKTIPPMPGFDDLDICS